MQILDIKLDEITDPTFQPRDKLEVEGIEALSHSIKEIGLINPVVVRKSEEGYQLVAGTRRWHACKALGWDTIPAKVIEQDTREASMLQFSENFHRMDLNPIQQAKMIKFMLEDLQYSTSEIAQFTNHTREWVSRQLTLLDMDQAAQDAIEAGKISASVSLELKLIPDEKLRSDYINYAIESGCTEKAARDWARQAKATVAARDARLVASETSPLKGEEEPYQPPPPRTCALGGAPEDKVVLEDWAVCWHCGKELKQP